ncbi:MAG: hypothetical protein HY763_01680 [Planctomycetes bacterium]|nr:hypothetical protein [Planctomycetota bacterium]
MHNRPNLRVVGAAEASPQSEPTVPYCPSMDVREIFRTMLAAELRTGRLTPARRRNIIRYGAQLNMSAVDVGRMIDDCRQAALQSEDPVERYHALNLAEPADARLPLLVKVLALLAGAELINLLFSRWM